MVIDKNKEDDDLDGLPQFDEDDLETEQPKEGLKTPSTEEAPIEESEIIVEIEEPNANQPDPAQLAEDGEKKQKGRRAEKRIKQLVAQVHDLEHQLRLKAQEAEQARVVSTSNQEAAIMSAEAAIVAEEEALKRDWIEADESGDSQKKFEVNQKLTTLVSKKNMLNAYKKRTAVPTQAQPQIPTQPQPAKRAEDLSASEIEVIVEKTSLQNPLLGDWIKKNKSWFFSETDMRDSAMRISDRMIAKEGYDPESEDYLTELDRRIAAAFPNNFRGASPQKRPSLKTPGGSQPPGTAGAKPVIRGKLTPDEVRMAREMGFSPEQWLASKVAIERESKR